MPKPACCAGNDIHKVGNVHDRPSSSEPVIIPGVKIPKGRGYAEVKGTPCIGNPSPMRAKM
jgi:hypothetical protein